jgi:hypothetical protein
LLVTCLQREVAAREAHGGGAASAPRSSPSASPWRSSTSTTPAGLKRELITHLGTLDFVTARENPVFLGPAVTDGLILK